MVLPKNFQQALGTLVLVLAKSTISSASCNVIASHLDMGPHAHDYAVGCLPDVNFTLPASWAGSIDIPKVPNNELYFWLFEAEDQVNSDKLIIWLNGGPGCSSLGGLAQENGPFRFPGNAVKPSANPYAWTKLGNVLYIDQPSGAGFSDGNGNLSTNAQVTEAFEAWIGAFFDTFPCLRTKSLFITGESYAGIYIPYLTQALLKHHGPRIMGLAIGDPTFGNGAALTDVVATTYLKNHSLGIPKDIISVFEKADDRCGFTKLLDQVTYPPKGKISIPGNPEGENFKRVKRQIEGDNGCTPNPDTPTLVNHSINACNAAIENNACATFATGQNYLGVTRPCFSSYNIDYDCTTHPNITAYADYLNLPAVRAAIHAPNKTYEACNVTIQATLTQEYVAPPAYEIIPAILDAKIPIHIYSGEKDYLLNHYGAELIIQNMTWGGKQGFQHVPNNTFVVNGTSMGNWGSERGLSYYHILNAGHAVPYDNPAAAFVLMKDYVLAQPKTGYPKHRVLLDPKPRINK